MESHISAILLQSMQRQRLGFGLHGDAPLATVREAAAATEVYGLDSFWLSQPPHQNGLVPLAEAADVTRLLHLGAGVIPLSHHSPPETVADVLDLHLPVDRLLLGVGSGSGPKGLQRVRSGIQHLRTALTCPIVVAALGPRMSRLAGEVADGVLLNWLTPRHARASIEWVREGARAAGRPMPATYAYVRVALGRESMDRLELETVRYGAIPHYAAHFRRQKISATATCIAGTTPSEIRRQLAAWEGVVDEVIVRALPAHDTAAETLAILQAVKPS